MVKQMSLIRSCYRSSLKHQEQQLGVRQALKQSVQCLSCFRHQEQQMGVRQAQKQSVQCLSCFRHSLKHQEQQLGVRQPFLLYFYSSFLLLDLTFVYFHYLLILTHLLFILSHVHFPRLSFHIDLNYQLLHLMFFFLVDLLPYKHIYNLSQRPLVSLLQ